MKSADAWSFFALQRLLRTSQHTAYAMQEIANAGAFSWWSLRQEAYVSKCQGEQKCLSLELAICFYR